MNNPYYFTNENIKVGFKIILAGHNMNHANSFSNSLPIYTDNGIESRYNNKILNEKATIYARLSINIYLNI